MRLIIVSINNLAPFQELICLPWACLIPSVRNVTEHIQEISNFFNASEGCLKQLERKITKHCPEERRSKLLDVCYSRNTMTTGRLNGLALLFIHQEIEPSIEEVINSFSQMSTRRIEFFSLFWFIRYFSGYLRLIFLVHTIIFRLYICIYSTFPYSSFPALMASYRAAWNLFVFIYEIFLFKQLYIVDIYPFSVLTHILYGLFL